MLLTHLKQCCTALAKPEGLCCKHVPCGKLSSGFRHKTRLRNGMMICRHSLVLPASQSRTLKAGGRSHNATCSMTKEPKQGWTQLHQAASDNRVKQVKKLLASGTDLSIKDDKGRTALQYAARRGHWPVIRCLLAHGDSVNTQDAQGLTPLHAAVIIGNMQAAQMLLTNGADPNIKSHEGTGSGLTALHLAVTLDKADCARRLIHHNPNLIAVRHEGDVALGLAVLCNSCKVVAMLLGYDDDMSPAKLASPATPFLLHWTAAIGHVDVADILVSRNIEVDAVDSLGMTPLMYACGRGNIDMVRYLLSHGANPLFVHETGSTPLHYAGFKDAIVLTLDMIGCLGQDTDISDEDSEICKLKFALLSGVTSESPEVIQLLVQHGADVSATDRKGSSVSSRKAEAVFAAHVNAFLVHCGCTSAHNGATALHYAASSNNVEAFKRLLLCNASIDAQDCEGNTPLHYAAMTDALDVAKHAVAHGASVEVRDKQGASPAHAAVAGWNPPSPNADCEEHLVGLLDCWTVESSSEPVLNSSSVVRERMAALHTARFKKKGTSMLDFLVSSGADVNCTTDQGLTPLHHAALGGNVQHVQALLAHGADVNAQATIELVNRDSITYPDLHEPEYIPSWSSYHVEFVALYGWTPLQAAITKGVQTRQMRINTDDGQVQSDTEDGNLFQVVSLLVDAGASLSARP